MKQNQNKTKKIKQENETINKWNKTKIKQNFAKSEAKKWNKKLKQKKTIMKQKV